MTRTRTTRWRRYVKRFTLGTLVIFVGLVIVLVATAGVHTEPFRDAEGEIIPTSIAVMETFDIGSTQQMLWFRGLNTNNPALVLLHGGPGFSDSSQFRYYNSDLEKYFLVVYWDQRGAGRSLANTPPDSLNMSQFVSDLDEVVEIVKERFDKEKVILLGHSWGTAIGTAYAHDYPENVAAYVGVGQVANMPQGETASYTYSLSTARAQKNQPAIRALEELGLPPHSFRQMVISRTWVDRLGGAVHQRLASPFWSMLKTTEASWWDVVLNIRGNLFSYRYLWSEFRAFEPDTRYLEFSVPVFFVEGRYDWQIPAVVAASYFERISAPYKEFLWFEASGHNVPFEQPARFNRLLIDKVLPLSQ